ncbi:MAG TPA: biosynthetic-type acetolactate synthase large subunit [Elusimicrobiota bacterium]|nr:biosynthetic-type acetolactate synthase large subunit [Elusimicrobiota bacterium]
MAEMTGAQIVCEVLKREGVEVVFGIPGGVNLPLNDALGLSGIRFVLTRHEQGAAHMADGYARATGKAGVCFATSGPGATNLVTGLATAHMDSIPVVALTGQVRTDSIGSDAFQEADITGITRPITKHNYLVKDIRDLRRTLQEAFYIAVSGRPGPVLVDLPVDIQRAKMEFDWDDKIEIRSYRPTTKGHPVQIKRAAELIKESKRPLLYVGGGTVYAGASAELKRLAEKGNIPVAWTLMANGAFPPNHVLAMGPLGMHGKYSTNIAMQKADLLIAAGSRFDDRVTGKLDAFSPHSKKIHIDIDPANISKTVHAHCPVVGDLKSVLGDLADSISTLDHSEWVKEITEMDRQNPLAFKQDDVLRPQYLIQELHRLTKGDAIISTGVGQHQMWAMQWYPCNEPRHFLTSGGLGTMGYGFPAALGAKFAFPDRTVVCIDGDASFQMTSFDLVTSVLEKRPVLVIIINNFFLGMVRQWQELFYDKRFASSCMTAEGGKTTEQLQPNPAKDKYWPDFVKLAEAHGALGLRAMEKKDVTSSLERALQEVKRRSVVLEVFIDPEEKVFPMVPAGKGLDEIIVDMA